MFQAAADFNSIAFHEKYLLPFYDWCLKGQQTSYLSEPAVRYHLMGANTMKTADAWPPANITYRSYYLKKGPTGSVKSLNDGALDTAPPAADGGETVFNYPDPGWRAGVVTFGPQGPDTVARILTFTSAPLEDDLEVVGPIKLVLHAASSNTDTDFIVKLSEQFPQASTEQGKVQPRFRVVSKGWMKASHRELNKQLSTEYAPWYAHTKVEPLEPGKPYMLRSACHADSQPVQEGQPNPTGAGQRRFRHHRLRVRASLSAEQDRQGYDFSLGRALADPAAGAARGMTPGVGDAQIFTRRRGCEAAFGVI